MGFGGSGGIQRDGGRVSEAFTVRGAESAMEVKTEQAASAQNAQAIDAKTARPSKTKRPKKNLKALAKTVSRAMKMKKEKRMLPVKQIKDSAHKHSQKNPELKARVLQLLRQKIKPDTSKKEIMETLEEFYPDATLADDAMEFLLDTTEGQLHQEVKEAKQEHEESQGREIRAGRNISTQAREAASKGFGTATSMRDMYRDITGNPRDSNTLFQELSQKYDYKELQIVVKFLLHSMGADMKSKGPSIPRGELHRLLTETRSLQAILGVYRFYEGRMELTQKMFNKSGVPMSKKLTSEMMAKCFMDLAKERYPSGDKVLAQSRRLGVENSVPGKIIVFSQFRDSIREVAMSQIYRNLQHRDDLMMAIIEALEDLEDELEELEELDERDEEIDMEEV